VRGGALELFDCAANAVSATRGVASARKAGRIAPRPGRLVLFAVSPTALHQVREVTRGERCSLAGWFRP
jgi:Rps23 Pro-64 3,4-dihydroxylase Tpa1-like proline 4-hydroxylase